MALRYPLVLAMLVAVCQAPVPVPGQTADHIATQTKNLPKDKAANGDKPAPSASPIAIQQDSGSAPSQTPADQKKATNTQESVTITKLPSVSVERDWIDYLTLVFTFGLVLVGIFGIRAALRTLKAIETQAVLMEAALRQWVSVENWRSRLTQPRTLRIDFDVVNPSSFPLTMAGVFKFNGTLPGAPTLTIPDAVILPSKPLTVGADVLLTNEQANSYVREGLRISLHGEHSHIGASKQRSPTMEIHANIVCRSSQPTVTEYESTYEKRSNQEG